ncbi:MAG: hypothetical protein HQL73_06915 [Magnetococcales bacterium]|nr:hypothetical protein [Magnetococcales bacterium]
MFFYDGGEIRVSLTGGVEVLHLFPLGVENYAPLPSRRPWKIFSLPGKMSQHGVGWFSDQHGKNGPRTPRIDVETVLAASMTVRPCHAPSLPSHLSP